MRISIIVPCYNEQAVLKLFYVEIVKVLEKITNNYELLFVDDGSQDSTLSIIKTLCINNSHIKYIAFSRNFGKEAAMYAGFCNVDADYVAVMDADMQDPPSLLPEMIQILESGKYDIGTKGAWYTEERAKKFIIPKEPIGASIIGFTVRKEDANKYKNIDDFAKEKGKLVPISPQNAQWNVIKEYNEKHKDQQIELTAAESFKVADAYAWVLEGRYDAFFDIKLSFEKAVTDKDGSYHQYADKLSWFAYKGIPTYPLIHKDKKNEKFAEAYSKAIKELEKDGTLAKLSKKYFGEDVFSYVDKEK